MFGPAINRVFAKVNCNVDVSSRIPHFQPTPIQMHNSSNAAANFAKPGAAFVIATETTHQLIISLARYSCRVHLVCSCSYARPIVKAVYLHAHTSWDEFWECKVAGKGRVFKMGDILMG